MPKRRCIRSRVTVCIESIDAIMLSGDKHDVVRPLGWNRQIRHIKRLRVNRTINWLGKDPAETIAAHVRRRQNLFIGVQSSARVITVTSQYVHWRSQRNRTSPTQDAAE